MIKDAEKTAKRKTNLKNAAYALPLALLLLMSVATAFGGILFFIYSWVILAAWQSSMAFLIIFGASALCFGFMLISLSVFNSYLKTFYNKTNLPQVKLFHVKSAAKYKKTAADGATQVHGRENGVSSESKKGFVRFITFFNIGCVCALIGTVFAGASAFMGAINRDNWVDAKADYMAQNGYYKDINVLDISLPLDKNAVSLNPENNNANEITYVDTVEIKLRHKNAVLIFNDAKSQGMARITGYLSYIDQIKASKSDDGKTITISEFADNRQNRPIDKMLFFLFKETEPEKQIRIYLPLSLKDTLTVYGEHIVAKN